ncbi:MAG: F0F1 ATP synthase subunit delta [Wolinella sp.]
MRELVAKRYAKALVESIGEEKIPLALEWFKKSEKAFRSEDFIDVILSPQIPKALKSQVMIDILEAGKRVGETRLINFVKALAERNRLELLPDICKELERFLAKSRNEYVATLTLKEAFDEATLKAIEAMLAKKLHAKLVLSQREENLEGVRLVVEDLGIEVSFLRDRFINDLRNHILQAF